MHCRPKNPLLAALALTTALVAAPTGFSSEAWAQKAMRPAETSMAVRSSQNPDGTTNPEGGAFQRMSMGVGKSVIVDLPRDASEIFVGNPETANAVVRSARKLYIIGVKKGQTTIFAMDAQGRRIATLEVNIGRDVGELQRIFQAAIPDADISARTVEDTIILTGTVSSAGDAQKAIDIANGFLSSANVGGNAAAGTAPGAGSVGKVINSLSIRGRDQVMLRVAISEVQRSVMKQLGVTAGDAAGGWGKLSMVNSLPEASSALDLGRAGTNGISATLKALERYGVARVLAEPSVTTISGESAKFVAGGEVPVPSGQTCTIDASGKQTCIPGGATFKQYGVSLNFSPVVLSEGRILLRVATEVTEVDNTQSAQISGTTVVGFRTRKNETTVELPSGGSIVSGGLLQVKSRQAINGLPGLMNLPVLGALFRSREFQREETELLIVVTPYIVKSVSPSDIARPDDGFAEASDAQGWLLGRVNRLYSTTSNPQAVNGFKGRIGFIID